MKDKIHHYTTIETLALILKTKKIRFNRLDRVDDVTESKIYGNYDMSKYNFISCWTAEQEESIPQWHMYTDKMRGVRISLARELFNYQPLNTQDGDFVTDGVILSPIPFKSMWTDDYFILPIFTNRENFERKVEYVENPYDSYKDVVKIAVDEKGYATVNIKEVAKFAKYKNLEWKFQNEIRFVLFILPGCPIPKEGINDKKFGEEFTSLIVNSVLKGIAPNLDYFDVELNPAALDNIEITLGPLHSDGDRIIVESLLDKYTKNGKLKVSNLTGNIRKPKR